jgi:hypothetical protein
VEITLGSMERDHEAEAKRREQSVRTRDAAKPDEAGKRERKHIDPERLYKAIRYLKEHPEEQVRQFPLRIFDRGPPTLRVPTASMRNIISDRCPRTRQ